uniref:Fatty acyl-CoA reductase n=1 Tax=Cacopsylla melanoneura TaxID=428564 RepID=A0A8D8X928_9HEMI
MIPHILDRKPNTYIFTKTISEDLVRRQSDHLPIVVVRPSIVMPTLAEPYSYYSNDKNSLLGLMGGAGIGLIRVGCVGPNIKVDLIPADVTVNCILAVGWHKATTPDSPKIYNCVGHETEVELKEFLDTNLHYLKEAKEAVDIVLWKTHSIRVQNTFLLFFLYYLLHILPGLFFSLAERYQNRKPMIMKIYRKFFFLEKTIRYFVSYDWSFTNDNTKSLLFKLNERDRELFEMGF